MDALEAASSQRTEGVAKEAQSKQRWLTVLQIGVYLFPVLLGYATQSVLAGVAAYALASCVLNLASTTTDIQVVALEKEVAVLRKRIEGL